MIKIIISLVTLGVVSAQYAYPGGIVKAAPVIAAGPVYKPIPYQFGYENHDGFGTKNFQKEQGDGAGNKVGSYGYVDPHGIHRQVSYIADAHGFRAQIKTNEPGTANAPSAGVAIHAAPVIVAPIKAKAGLAIAPAYAKAAIAAPAFGGIAGPAYGGFAGQGFGVLAGSAYGGLAGSAYGGLAGSAYGGLAGSAFGHFGAPAIAKTTFAAPGFAVAPSYGAFAGPAIAKAAVPVSKSFFTSAAHYGPAAGIAAAPGYGLAAPAYGLAAPAYGLAAPAIGYKAAIAPAVQYASPAY